MEPICEKKCFGKIIYSICNCCASTRVLCKHEIFVRAQESCACTRFLCMHKNPVHAQESCACTRILRMHKALVYSKNGNNWNATTIETVNSPSTCHALLVNSPHNLRRCGWTRLQLAKLAGELALNFVAGSTLRVNSPPNLRRCGWTRPITWDVAGEFAFSFLRNRFNCFCF